MCFLPIALAAGLAIAQTRPTPKHDFATLAANADAARAGDRLAEAALLYRKALALRPAWLDGWWSLGMVEYVRDNYAEAAFAFQKLIALTPKTGDGTSHVMLGLCEFELGHDERALQNIVEGEKIGVPADAQIANVMRFHEGILMQRLGRFEGAREVLEGLCVDGLQPKTLVNGLGMVALRMSDRNPPPEGSVAARVVASLGLAMSYAAQHKFEQARQLYVATAQQYPDFPNVHYAYGRFLSETRDLPAAAQELQHEIKNYPGNVVARLQIASDSYRINSAAGLPYAEEAVRLDPKYPFGHYVLGLLLLDAGNYRKAISELEIARRTFPHQVSQVYVALGTAYARVGRMEDAKQARAVCAQLQKQQSSAQQSAPKDMDAGPPQ